MARRDCGRRSLVKARRPQRDCAYPRASAPVPGKVSFDRGGSCACFDVGGSPTDSRYRRNQNAAIVEQSIAPISPASSAATPRRRPRQHPRSRDEDGGGCSAERAAAHSRFVDGRMARRDCGRRSLVKARRPQRDCAYPRASAPVPGKVSFGRETDRVRASTSAAHQRTRDIGEIKTQRSSSNRFCRSCRRRARRHLVVVHDNIPGHAPKMAVDALQSARRRTHALWTAAWRDATAGDEAWLRRAAHSVTARTHAPALRFLETFPFDRETDRVRASTSAAHQRTRDIGEIKTQRSSSNRFCRSCRRRARRHLVVVHDNIPGHAPNMAVDALQSARRRTHALWTAAWRDATASSVTARTHAPALRFLEKFLLVERRIVCVLRRRRLLPASSAATPRRRPRQHPRSRAEHGGGCSAERAAAHSRFVDGRMARRDCGRRSLVKAHRPQRDCAYPRASAPVPGNVSF